MANISDVEALIAEQPGLFEAGEPASEELILAAEKFLQVRFPSDYREFLKRWGTLSVGPTEFYGLTGQDFEHASVPDSVWFTAMQRRDYGFPKDLLVLYDNNGDEFFCLDVSNPDKSPVVVWDVINQSVVAERAPSFSDFVIEEAQAFM